MNGNIRCKYEWRNKWGWKREWLVKLNFNFNCKIGKFNNSIWRLKFLKFSSLNLGYASVERGIVRKANASYECRKWLCEDWEWYLRKKERFKANTLKNAALCVKINETEKKKRKKEEKFWAKMLK